jgi:hypothetical protein
MDEVVFYSLEYLNILLSRFYIRLLGCIVNINNLNAYCMVFI